MLSIIGVCDGVDLEKINAVVHALVRAFMD